MMDAVFNTLLAATAFTVTVTLLPLRRSDAWWVRVQDFPRFQIWFLSVVLLVLEFAFLDLSQAATWGLLLFAGLSFFYQTWWIVPYTPLFSKEVKRSTDTHRQRTIRFMTANVLTPNRNSQALLDLVREHQPDVLVTLESDQWWQERLDALEEDYPYTIKCPLDNLYGMHVYSRLPLSDRRIDYLVEPGKPSMHTLVSLPSGQPIRVHFLHPAPPGPTKNEASTERDAELIIVAKSVADVKMPVVVTGDLNDVAWSATTRLFRNISGLLDPRIGRGMFNTFHADYWFLRWPLDHLFHSDHFTLSRLVRLPRFGSDHFPLLTELTLAAGGTDQENDQNLDPDDRSRANSKTDAENVSQDDVPQPG